MKTKSSLANVSASVARLILALCAIMLLHNCASKVQQSTVPKKEAEQSKDFVPGGSIIWVENFNSLVFSLSGIREQNDKYFL